MTQENALRVSTPRFNRSIPQRWHDSWRNRDRIMRFKGKCIGCRRRTYGFDDGEDDPRGILGNHAAQPLVASEHNLIGADVPCCFACQNNTEEQYLYVLRRAVKRWTPPPRRPLP